MLGKAQRGLAGLLPCKVFAEAKKAAIVFSFGHLALFFSKKKRAEGLLLCLQVIGYSRNKHAECQKNEDVKRRVSAAKQMPFLKQMFSF